MNLPLTAAQSEARALEHLAGIARQLCGLSEDATRPAFVRSRLEPRRAALGHSCFATYRDHIISDAGSTERHKMVAALTTKHSAFFREDHHFKRLQEQIFPPLAAIAAAGGPVRIWSAGCAAGQEAFSIAMSFLDAMPDAARHDVKILATDIDDVVLAKCHSGEFDARAVGEIPAAFTRRHLTIKGGKICMSDDLRAIVCPRPLNLLAPWPMRRPFDVIFCRNVLIYFGNAQREQTLIRLSKALQPSGWLFLGHSDRVTGPAAMSLQPRGMAAFQSFPQAGAVSP